MIFRMGKSERCEDENQNFRADRVLSGVEIQKEQSKLSAPYLQYPFYNTLQMRCLQLCRSIVH